MKVVRHSKDWNNGFISGIDTAHEKGVKWARHFVSAKQKLADHNGAAKPVADYWEGYAKAVTTLEEMMR